MAAEGIRLLHHEAVQIRSRSGIGTSGHLTFDAYGRRFELSVAPNERIRRALTTSNTTTPLQGTVQGISGSWVRITRSASGWRGMIFDGQSLYAIEPASDVAGTTVEPLSVSGAAPVVYRLDDALLSLDQMSCEVVQPDTPSTAAEAVKLLSHELRVQAATAELTASKMLRVGVVGDYEFVTQFTAPATPEDAIVARMNIVDGIFTSQLRVKISLAPSTLFGTSNEPFSKTVALDLLTELRTYRASSPTQLALGLTHLMTGRDLDGDTVGIAYIGSVCSGSYAASLSEGRLVRGTTQAALIAAHEIGHNFGASHDGETGACSNTPQTFLMAPQLNGSDQFSVCSVEQIQPVLNNAQCLSAYLAPDASLEIGTPSMQETVNSAFVASFTVRALGDDASNEVSVTATLPSGLTVQSATANGGTCTTGAGTAMCTLGTLAAGDTRRIYLTLMPTEAGSFSVNIALSSANDSNLGNNSGVITISTSSTPPATGANAAGSGEGRLDFILLALLFSAVLLRRTPALVGTRRRHQPNVH